MITPVNGKEVIASWYSLPGQTTACGNKMNPNALTAAHKTLPCGTKIRVSRNGVALILTIDDRGPYIKNRTLDLSKEAARRLGCIPAGTCKVNMEVL